jgi:hypothetical protein
MDMKRSKVSLLGFALALLAGCATGARPAAVFKGPPHSPNSALVVRISPEKSGVSKVSLSGGLLQSAVIHGDAKMEGEGWRISLSRLDWFDNWANGWTQASFLLDGTASLQPGPTGWSLVIESAPQLDTVDSASIRYFDTYLRGDKGRSEFSHRWDRIQAVAVDMLMRLPASALVQYPRVVRRYLFPEIYGYEVPPSPTHAKVLAQGFAWNGDYTKEHFSERLRVLRDSGSLLRDYKESPGLWSLALAWKSIWEQDGRSIVLLRKK